MRGVLRIGVAAWVAALLGFGVGGTAIAGTLHGTARVPDQTVLPPGAVLEAQLQDVSRADAPALVLGRARLDPMGEPPWRFAITYDDAAIRPGMRYSVRATVTHQGRLLLTTDRMHPVLDGRDAPIELQLVWATRRPASASPADLLGPLPASFQGELPGAGHRTRWHLDLTPDGRFQLRMVYVGRPQPNTFDDIGRWTREPDSGRIVLRGGREAPVYLLPVDAGAALRKLDLHGKPIESAHPDRLLRQARFAPLEPQLFLAGMFSVMADAPSIVVCADRRSVSVSMEADYEALEAAYLRSGAPPGQRVLVTLDGWLAVRPSMEPGQAPRTALVVQRFAGIWPGQRCPATPTSRRP